MTDTLTGLEAEPATIVEAGDLLIIALPDYPETVQAAHAIQAELDKYLPPGAQVMFIPGATMTVVKKGSTA